MSLSEGGAEDQMMRTARIRSFKFAHKRSFNTFFVLGYRMSLDSVRPQFVSEYINEGIRGEGHPDRCASEVVPSPVDPVESVEVIDDMTEYVRVVFW